MEEDRKLLKTTLNMVWPAVLESVFLALTALVDAYMVSTLGENAVAAVGITTQPRFLGLAFCFAIQVSVSVLVARRFGQQNKRAANRILLTGLLLVTALSVVVSSLSVVFAENIMELVGASPETEAYAVTYFSILMGGLIFTAWQMCINAVQRGAGNTKIAMKTNVVSNTVNVIFNYLLIGGNLGFPRLGIAGAAIATVLGAVVASIMCLMSIIPKDRFVNLPYIIAEKIRPSIESFQNIVSVGYSIFFEQILIRIGFMSTAFMAAKQGTSAMAAHQVTMNLLSLSFAFGDGLQAAAVALIGKSLGEERPELAKRYGRICGGIAIIIAAFLAVFYLIGSKAIYMMFFDDPSTIDIGIRVSRVLIAAIIFQVPSVVFVGALRGAGDTLYTTMSSTVSVTIIRTSVSYLFGYVLNFGIEGIWLGIVGDQVSRLVLSLTRFRKGKWTKIRI